VCIKNAYKAIPTIEFTEEMIIEVDGILSSKKEVGTVGTTLIDPTVTFDLLNPENDQVIGIGNYQNVYICIYSVYRYLTDKRDIKNLKWKALTEAKTALDDGHKLSTEKHSELLTAKNKSDKDPENVTLIAVVTGIQKEYDVLALAEKDLSFAVDAASAAYEIASNF
jgi:hypothetical protein